MICYIQSPLQTHVLPTKYITLLQSCHDVSLNHKSGISQDFRDIKQYFYFSYKHKILLQKTIIQVMQYDNFTHV